MRIKAKDVLAQEAQPKTISDADVERGLQEGEDLKPSGESKLKHEYDLKGEPDRLRLLDQKGSFWDVYPMPDGSVAVQKLQIKVDYTGKINKYKTWDEAEKAIPTGWDVFRAINAAMQKSASLTRMAFKLRGKIVYVNVVDEGPKVK